MNTISSSARTFLVLLMAAACLSFVLIASATERHSQSVRFVPAKPPGQAEGRVSDFAHVVLDGEINSASPRQLALALDTARRHSPHSSLGGRQMIYVFLNSPGGNVGAAIAMGRMIRANAADVWIDREASCSSACILVLAGGVSRWAVPEARLGLHRPYFEPRLFAGLSHDAAQKKYSQLAAAVKQYLDEMGISTELFDTMVRIPSDGLLELDHDAAERSGLLGKDPAFEEWDKARYQQLLARYESCLRQGRSELECETRLRSNRQR